MKTFIGRWLTPSGNGCDVYMIADDLGRNLGQVLWDIQPPSREDLRFYRNTVLPIFADKTLVFLEVTTR
jgi:hypothetical protein